MATRVLCPKCKSIMAFTCQYGATGKVYQCSELHCGFRAVLDVGVR